MLRVGLFFSCLFAFSAGLPSEDTGSVFSLRDDDPLQLVKRMISFSNEQLAKSKMSFYSFPGFSYSFKPLFSAEVQGGSVGNFSTLALKGKDNIFNQTQANQTFNFDFNLGLGLDDLRLEFRQSLSILFFKFKGDLVLTAKTNVIRIIGTITKDQKSCTAVLTDGLLDSLDVDVSITPSGILNSSLRLVLQAVIKLGSSFGRTYINNRLNDIIQSDPAQFKFHEIACAQTEI